MSENKAVKIAKVTKVMKYEIVFDRDLYKLLRDIQYAVFRIKNKATSIAYDWQHFSFGYKERFGEFPKDKDVLGCTLTTDIRRNTADFGEEISSSTADSANKEAVDKFKELKNDIISGRVSIPTYKREGSFPIRASQIKSIEKANNGMYDVKLSLLSKVGAKERGVKTQVPARLKTGGGAKTILERVIDGTYNMCDSRIVLTKNKFYLALVYQHEVSTRPDLDKDTILGVDMGIVYPVYMAINNSLARYHIKGGEIESFRKQVESRRRELRQHTKYCGEGNRGRGRKKRMQAADKVGHKVENFRQTTNHKYAKYVVQMAVKHGCGTIQMEDLSGINETDVFLKNWPYFDLQEKITYKAKEYGIEVIKVDPKYTSQRCNKCGHIDRENRTDQATFHCKDCGLKTNADFNAAKNIATRDIDMVIKAEMKEVMA